MAYEVDPSIFEALDLPDLPDGYGYIGGAARAVALRILCGQDAPIRDLDIVAFDDFHPDLSHIQTLSKKHMPDDYAYGYGVSVDTLDSYFGSRDLTINEVAVVDGKLILTQQAEADLRQKIIRPSTHEKEYMGGVAGPKISIKMLLLEQVFQNEYNQGEAVEFDTSAVEPFYIALGLNKAMQYGEPIARAFVRRLDGLGLINNDAQTLEPAELAIDLRDVTDFVYRGFDLADRINRGESLDPMCDLLDGDSEFNDLEERYGHFGTLRPRDRRHKRGAHRATDAI